MALRIVVLVSVAVCAWCAAEAGKPSAEGDPRADIQVGYHAPPRHLEQPVSVLASGSGAHDLAVSVNATAGTYDVSFRGSTWLRGGEREIFCTRAAVALRQVAGAAKISGSDTWGAYSGVRMQWAPAGASDGSVVLQTSVRVYEGSPIAVFGQTWPQGAPAIPATRQCSAGAQYAGRDQTGGEEFANLGGGYTDETCCDACSNNTTCDVWVRQPSTGNCWLVKQPHGTKAADGRNIGFKQPLKSASDAVAAFPTFSTTGANETLNSITWGGCQVAPTVQTRWSDNPNPPGGETDGIPLSLYTESMDAMLLGPTDNFFVALHEQRDSAIGAGIKDSVGVIPPNFVHETILVGGQGFNDTLIAFGDALLAKSGKPRVDPYADTVLSNLGYWTDNGAYYYHSTSGFDNHEDAIKAKIKEGKNLSIPYNYVQWDDWWVVQKGDVPGITAWVPTASSIPDGMTDWLKMNTSLYVPMYASDNVYIQQGLGEWAIDNVKGSAIPLTRDFYDVMFKNGSNARMVMFEQDFLCTHNTATNLTNSDVYNGMRWVQAMDAAASDAVS